MVSTLASTLQAAELNNYVSFAIAVIAGYDYVLTLASEVKYVWVCGYFTIGDALLILKPQSRPRSWVSCLYILIRYLGCYSAIAASLNGSSIMPGPMEMCYVTYITSTFTFLLFLAAANMVMIFRVWAMYSRSRLILSILLAILIPDVILLTILAIMSSIRTTVVIDHVLDISFCSQNIAIYVPTEGTLILQFIPSAATCILVVIQFVRQSFQMYRVTKQWHLNQYMALLVREGVIYFVMILAFSILNLDIGHILSAHVPEWLHATLLVASYVPVLTLTPRFILGMRKLYARDIRGRLGSEIDTGFGFSSLSNSRSTIAFAGIDSDKESEGDEP